MILSRRKDRGRVALLLLLMGLIVVLYLGLLGEAGLYDPSERHLRHHPAGDAGPSMELFPPDRS